MSIHATGAARDERGAILVIVAAAMLALVLFVAFVVDVANWYEHKRHLQLQADAAALAGGHSLLGISGCLDSLVDADARRYGGPDATTPTAPYNAQVGGTSASNMHLLINSRTYYGEPLAGNNTDLNGSPCAAKYVDIKLTETNLPWFFGGLVPRINAHARVSLVQQSGGYGALPIAVPNPLPTSAGAVFIDEATGKVIASAPLQRVPGGSGPLDMWASSASPAVAVKIARATGIVIVLSGKRSVSLTGDLATICAQVLTDCYDASSDPPTRGLSFIRGYSPFNSGAQPNPPLLRSVELFGVTCPNTPYFSSNTSSCTYEIAARVDAGGLAKANLIIKANGVQLYSDPDPNCAVPFVVGTDPCWHALLTLPAGSAANAIAMSWEETAGKLTIGNQLRNCTTSGGNPCKGNFEGGLTIQRAYSAQDKTSGPIKVVKLFTCEGNPSCSLQSYQVDSTQSFVVSVGIGGVLQNATSTSDPLVTLRIESTNGQSLDCDPGYRNLRDELAKGCRPSYVPNDGSVDCEQTGTSALWGMPQPWMCLAVNTGRVPNDVLKGLNERILLDDNANVCPAFGVNGHNNWSLYRPDDPTGDDGFPPGDRRILDAYLTSYGAFSHVNGTSASVPVIGFGHFYVTGWTGQGLKNPCQTDGDDPVPNDDAGLIVGHFIRYVGKIGGNGTAQCSSVITDIDACVIVMTK